MTSRKAPPAVGFLWMLAWLATPAVAQPEPHPTPVYAVQRTPSPVTIDGTMNEPAWQRADILRFSDNVTGTPASLVSEARALYNDAFLMIGFRVEDTNLWATMRERDQHLWTEEVVEVFIQADPLNPNYIELEVNPLGTLLDIYLIDIRRPLPYRSWNSSKIQWAVAIDGSVDGKEGDVGWSCEIALPLEDVAMAPSIPPKPGDRWRVNLYRVESRPEGQGLAWSPTRRRDFHVPDRFGEFVFQD